jgi:preprotein translocase subunit Sec61beta
MILSQIDEWRKHLLDISKRNRLINFKLGRNGGISLIRPDATDLWHQLVGDESALTFPWKRELIDLPPDWVDNDSANVGEEGNDDDLQAHQAGHADVLDLCLSSPRLQNDHLLTTLTDKQLNARLNRLALNAREAETELGVNTLFAAFGLLRWYESDDSKEPVLSPLLLVPVHIDRKTVESPWVLSSVEDEVQRNDTLAELMKTDHRVVFPQLEALLEKAENLSELLRE